MLDRLSASVMDWWIEAGVDTSVEDSPRDWLAATPVRAVAPPMPEPRPVPPQAALAADLPAFRAMLLADPSIPGRASARVDSSGDPASGTMVIVDMPEPGDRVEGRLLGGEVGALFDKMIAAIGLSRETIYLAPLSPARPTSGRLPPETLGEFARLMRHHIGLAKPRRVLLMGDAPVRALLDRSAQDARGTAHPLTTEAGEVPAIASFHPRGLLRTPAQKAAAWADLKLFMAL